ncbi:MAG: hypothetical protein LBG30_07790, partial [Odoribacteraceae bacterium]|nr:hypothetical protein [Odoribacteraceae bacterium]
DDFVRSLDDFVRSLDDFVRSLDDFVRSLDDFVRSLDDFVRSLDDFVRSLDDFVRSLDDFVRSLDDFVRSLDEVVKSVSNDPVNDPVDNEAVAGMDRDVWAGGDSLGEFRECKGEDVGGGRGLFNLQDADHSGGEVGLSLAIHLLDALHEEVKDAAGAP